VIGPTGAVRVMVATKPVDFRKGSEGLAALLREEMRTDSFLGAVYVFRAKRADRVKLIFWDGTGMCLFAKRLENGHSAGPTRTFARGRDLAAWLGLVPREATTAGKARLLGIKFSSFDVSNPAISMLRPQWRCSENGVGLLR